jgi:hypothetical protein
MISSIVRIPKVKIRSDRQDTYRVVASLLSKAALSFCLVLSLATPGHAASCSNTSLGNGVVCINSASALSPNTNTVSITGFNATGANFLVMNVAQGTFAGVFCTPTDSSSNTWLSGPLQSNSTTGSQEQLFFAFNATVSASMTFSCGSSTGGFPAISVAAFSGVYSAGSPLDQTNGATTPTAPPTDDPSLATGSITGSNSGQLVVVGLTQLDNTSVSIGSGFTLFESIPSTTTFGTALAMKTVAAPAATSATWTPNVNFRASTTIASFATTALCTGASPSLTASNWSLVKNCHDIASSGDKITVTSGTYSAKVNVQITKYVHIVAGAGGVTLTDDVATCAAVNPCGFGPTQTIITFTEASAGSSSFEGFTINTGAANQVNPGGAIAAYAGGGHPVVFKNIIINDSGAYGNFDWFYLHQNRGVLVGNTFNATPNGGNCNTQVQFLQVEPEQTSADWATTVPFGNNDDGTHLVYMEGNTINHGGLSDNLSNGRTVFRYNTVTNTNFSIHGIAFVNGRYIDVYNNLWIHDTSLNPGTCTGGVDQNFNGFLSIGSGVAYVHHNTIPSANTLAWGPKVPIQVSADILTRDGGGWPCWNTLTGMGDGYPSPELPGWGLTGSGTITVCPGCNPASNGGPQDQGLDPMYFWGNTGAGITPNLIAYDPNTPNSGGSTQGCATAGVPGPYPSISAYIVEGREYYLDADAPAGKPGYSPFACPHPLAGLSGACDASTNGTAGFNISAATLTFTGQPPNTNSGSTMGSFQVTDSDNTFAGTITLTPNGCPAGFTNLSGTASAGVLNFTTVGTSGAGTGCAFTASAAGAASATSTTFNVVDVTPPVPGNSGTLSTANILTNSMTVNWTAATDNVTPQNQLQYEVCQATSNTISTVGGCEAALIQSFTTNIVTLNAGALNPSTTYWFNVVVKDAAGNKAAYTPNSATTQSAVIPPVITGGTGGRPRRIRGVR